MRPTGDADRGGLQLPRLRGLPGGVDVGDLDGHGETAPARALDRSPAFVGDAQTRVRTEPEFDEPVVGHGDRQPETVTIESDRSLPLATVEDEVDGQRIIEHSTYLSMYEAIMTLQDDRSAGSPARTEAP